MKAAVSSEQGLQIRDIPQPKPKPFEVLVKVSAAGLNRADLNAARGAGAHGSAGSVVRTSDGGIGFHAADGILRLDEVQLAGGRRTRGADLVRGRPQVVAAA